MNKIHTLSKLLLVALVLTSLARQCDAQPTDLSLTGVFSNRGSTLTLTVTPTSTAAGCTLELFGAQKKKLLSGDRSRAVQLSSVAGEDAAVQLLAQGVSAIKRGKRRSRKRTVFLSVVANCDGTAVGSEIVPLRVYQKKKGIRGAGLWLRELASKLAVEEVVLANAFEGLSLSLPVDLQSPKDGSDRIFVVEQGGLVKAFPRTEPASVVTVLDISSKLINSGERGLLGLSFHPNFSQNGYFFVNYSRKSDGATVIERYTMSPPSGSVADPNSAQMLLVVEQPFSNHNGGQLAFGPDGYLYIGLGDGGDAGDPLGHGQNRLTLLGSLLRIDVNGSANGKNYLIPSDNPFVGNGNGFQEEIFAYGLRNPWRFSFDRSSGDLWLADVGQNRREEVNVITNGGNYGWKTMEGTLCFSPDSGCSQTGLTLPILDYPRSEGESITGGYVYRGSSLSSLVGRYVYGDFLSGKIWALLRSGDSVSNTEIFDTELLISSFGVDESGELYVLSYTDGKIFKFVPAS